MQDKCLINKNADYQNPYYKIQMTAKDFAKLSSFINQELGIKMPAEKKVMLQSRLLKRLSELKINSFKDYIAYVFSREGREIELIRMIDLVTTNKTDFFREPVHFDFMREVVLPDLIFNHQLKKIKVWSAGCSSGEEPYTIAMIISAFLERYQRADYTVIATDLSTRILDKARTAIYDLDRVNGIPLSVKKKYFLKSKDPKNKTV
ncbi:MAG TPA: CheR family methyltransferase, partial [Bacteroidales bacterium]|nr:CheR family methyltransferase [Bacteroidales bacterium]